MEEAAIDIWASLETPSMIRCSVLGEAVGEKRIKKRKLGFKVKVVHGYKGTGLVVEEELFLGGGVAVLGRLNALLGCVWHANCHGFWRGGRAFERVGQECVKWRGEVTKVRFHFLLVTWPQIISFFLSSNSPTVSSNHTHFLLLLALLFQTLLFIFYSYLSCLFKPCHSKTYFSCQKVNLKQRFTLSLRTRFKINNFLTW
ncbi:hypothetical protein V8G54_026105 [Vigna mungo]|uniref:Transmembrane protein n=1 Tax=Vigna mungo TaxID=3915 RepID=A0AAQ3N0E5_VIGMU